MIMVTNSTGLLSEALLNISNDFIMEQSISDNSFQISFTTYPDRNPGYDLLTSESIITVDNNEFRVKQYSNNGYSKNITAVSIFFDLSKRYINSVYSGDNTLSSQLNFLFNGSGWNYIIEDNIGSLINVIENLGNSNVISLLNQVLNYHRIEYEVLPNRNLRFSLQIGPDNDFQYRYKHNLSSVVQKEDTSNLSTFIRGYGANNLESSYTSPNASIFGILEAQPIRDENFTNISSLNNFLKSSIQDTPQISIETEVPELLERSLGERVWLIYEPLNIEMQTRIIKQTKVLINDRLITRSIVFGNSVVRSSIDLLVAQQQNIEETKQESRAQIRTTNDRITLEVTGLNNTISAVDVKADSINLSVQNLDSRTSSSINLLQNRIDLKVDVGGSITDINLTPGNATINAAKINLNGAVFVNGSITGATNINIGNDATIGNNLYLGSQSTADGKGVRFSSGALITGNGTAGLRISALNIVIGDGIVDLSQASDVIYGSNAPRARFG